MGDEEIIGDTSTATAAERRLEEIKVREGLAEADWKCPEGMVDQRLTFRDLNLAFLAMGQACEKAPDHHRGGFFANGNLIDRFELMKRLLCHGRQLAYFEDLVEKYTDKEVSWAKEQDDYVKLRGPKPEKKKPEPTPQEKRGEELRFFLKSSRHSWLVEAIKNAQWPQGQSEFAAELRRKLKIKDEESS